MICDIYCSHEFHPFIYSLDAEEHEKLKQLCRQAVYHGIYSYAEAKASLSRLCDKLAEFFKENAKTAYFIRFNKLSPKDAYYFINRPESEAEDEVMTETGIRRDLDLLHIKADQSVDLKVEQCINVISHSDRIFCEISFSDELDMKLLLLEHRDINYGTETRCFIRDGNVFAISRYYTDFPGSYLDSPEVVKVKILDYFKSRRSTLLDYVADVHFNDKAEVELIELNPLTHGTDPCLFTWDELDTLQECTCRI
jgi:hypothetical protein